MNTAINALLTEITEEEASTVQGGLGFFTNSSFLLNGIPGFSAFFINVNDATGTAQSTPGTTAPIEDLTTVDPTKPDVRLNQTLFFGLAALFAPAGRLAR
jgi:hypothetical protein